MSIIYVIIHKLLFFLFLSFITSEITFGPFSKSLSINCIWIWILTSSFDLGFSRHILWQFLESIKNFSSKASYSATWFSNYFWIPVVVLVHQSFLFRFVSISTWNSRIDSYFWKTFHFSFKHAAFDIAIYCFKTM